MPRPGGQRNGLKVGQRVDNDLHQHVSKRRPLQDPGAIAVMSALRGRGLVPVLSQVRATSRELQLSTLVDLVCIRVGDHSVWAVEVKSTTLPRASHLTSYKRQCSRTAYMRNGLVHSECMAHQLQAVFGAMAMERTYGGLSNVRSTVAVVTGSSGGDRVVMYDPPDRLYSWAYYARRPPVPVRGAKQQGGRGRGRGRGQGRAEPGFGSWPVGPGSGEDDVLASAGLARRGPTRRGQSVYAVHRPGLRGKAGPTIGVVMCIPTRYDKLCRTDRARVGRMLGAAARRESAKLPGGRGHVTQLWLATDTQMLSRLGGVGV